MATPGKCHEEKAPEGGRPLSKVLLPHSMRTFACPHIFPRVTGLCLHPSSPTALHRMAETRCALSHRGTADIRGLWTVHWFLVILGHSGSCQSCCQCILLPAAASNALEKGSRALSGLEALGVHPPWGTQPSISPVASSQWAHVPSPAAPGYSGHQLLALSLVPCQTILSQRGNPGGQTWNSGQVWKPPRPPLTNVRCVQGPSPA